MAGPPSPRLDDNDCLRLPAASSPRIRETKNESTDLRLSQPCPPYVTPSSISSFGRRLKRARIAENNSLKSRGANTFCQSTLTFQNVSHDWMIPEAREVPLSKKACKVLEACRRSPVTLQRGSKRARIVLLVPEHGLEGLQSRDLASSRSTRNRPTNGF